MCSLFSRVFLRFYTYGSYEYKDSLSLALALKDSTLLAAIMVVVATWYSFSDRLQVHS
jgi:hypothetical protein